MRKLLFIWGLFIVLSIHPQESYSQCAMCKLVAKNNTAGDIAKAKGVNAGILYLLFAPYFACSVVGFVWYKKYRKKRIKTQF